MVKPGYVYHGSSKDLNGDKLIPKKAFDLDECPDNILEAVYASDSKEGAIAMGILSCQGIRRAGCDLDKKRVDEMTAIVYEGWPEQEYFYLYTLSSESFQNRPVGSHQWVSFEEVKPIKIEKLLVKDYIHLIRKATEEERESWLEKYGDKLKVRENVR